MYYNVRVDTTLCVSFPLTLCSFWEIEVHEPCSSRVINNNYELYYVIKLY